MTKEMLENGGKKEEEENPTLIHSKQQKGGGWVGKTRLKRGWGTTTATTKTVRSNN